MTTFNTDNAEFPGDADIQAVFKIVSAATTATSPSPPANPMELRLDELHTWLASHAMYAVLIMLVTAGLAFYTKSQPLVDTMFTLVIISQVLAVAMIIPVIVSGALFLRSVRKSPYALFLGSVQASAQIDRENAEALAKLPRVALQYVLTYYKYERNGYEKRTGMLVGAIDKVGIFPALAGLVILVWNLLKLPGATAWAGFFGPLLLAFYFLAMATTGMIQKMDRVIALLEYSVQSRN